MVADNISFRIIFENIADVIDMYESIA